MRRLSCIALLGILAIAVPAHPAEGIFVKVRKGDTLFGIARVFSTTVDRIRRDNHLRGDLIHPGQRLVLSGTRGVSDHWKGEVRVDPPIRGLERRDIVTSFGVKRSPRHRKIKQRHTGLDLRARKGSVLRACARGVVRFSGDLSGFGRVLVIEHDGGWRSVYSPCDPSRVLVEVNEAVYRGQPLGYLAGGIETEKPAVHFELRRGQKAVDPTTHIRWPARGRKGSR